MNSLEKLIGLTLECITHNEYEMIFFTSCGRKFRLYHSQDCCESVYIDDVVGDVFDLIGSPILLSEETSQEDEKLDKCWTFYKLATVKGYLTIKWVADLNSYYSTSVDFTEI